MAKRRKPRKRTNKNVPAKGVLRDNADRLWSLAVRNDWNHRCAVCDCGVVESHHILPRQWEAVRCDLRNGIALCATHHKFGPESPHQNGPEWMKWLADNYPGVCGWVTLQVESGDYKIFDGTKNAWHYIERIQSLQQYVESEDYTRIIGVKFAAWLDSQDVAKL